MHITIVFIMIVICTSISLRMIVNYYFSLLNLNNRLNVRRLSCKIPNNKVVLISKLNSIYENLALENWLLRHRDFTNTDLLLIWRDNPCVVIGRHQNPWQEANLPYLEMNKILLARRQSGGGTVYHDENTINFSFLTDKIRHCRQRNLELVAKSINNKYNINIQINKRHDLVIDNKFKVSGSAAKLIAKSAYHHFTLLLDCDPKRMSNSLSPTLIPIISKATASIRSPVSSLRQYDKSIEFQSLIDIVIENFNGPQKHVIVLDTLLTIDGNDVINTLTEDHFPGITDIINELISWNFIFGSTPKFSVRTLHTGSEFTVENGIVESISQSIDDVHQIDQNGINIALGQRFSYQLLNEYGLNVV